VVLPTSKFELERKLHSNTVAFSEEGIEDSMTNAVEEGDISRTDAFWCVAYPDLLALTYKSIPAHPRSSDHMPASLYHT